MALTIEEAEDLRVCPEHSQGLTDQVCHFWYSTADQMKNTCPGNQEPSQYMQYFQ